MKAELLKTINQFIQHTGRSANQLAILAGIEPSIVYRFLNGDRSISLETAEKILRVIETYKPDQAA